MILLSCSFDSSIGRFQLEDYVRELEVAVLSFDALGQEVTVGKIAATQILWADAENDGESLLHICDADSHGLCEVYRTLTNNKREIRADLKTYEVVDHVIFVYRIVLHPALAVCRQGILETVLTLFSEASLAVMWKDTGDFSEAELAGLGYCKIAGEELIFRHSAFKTPFSEKHPRGMEVDFVGKPEHQAWVEEQWGENGN